jgi:hypothetical protein
MEAPVPRPPYDKTPERLEEIVNYCAEFGVTLEDNVGLPFPSENSFFEEIRSQQHSGADDTCN